MTRAFWVLTGSDQTHGASCARAKEIKKLTTKPYCSKFGVRSDHPRARIEIRFCIGSLRVVVLNFKFRQKRFSDFGVVEVEISHFPLLWLMVYTTACTTVQTVIFTYIAVVVEYVLVQKRM